MGMFFHSSEAPPERPADPEVRRANLNRIGRLFGPYRVRLGGVLLLIVVSAGLGVVPAFLLKSVLEAIGRNDTRALSFNAGGIIAIAIATGVLGVIQTLLSNQIGQRVMHDLRAAVFRHLVPRAGVALGVRDPAREDDGTRRRARRPLRGRLVAPRRPRGTSAHGGALGDGVDSDELRDHARRGLLVRRARARERVVCGL